MRNVLYSLISLITLPGSLYAGPSRIADSLRQYYYKAEPAGNHYIVNQGVFSTVFNAQGKPCFPFRYRKLIAGFNGCYYTDENTLIDSNGTPMAYFYGQLTHMNNTSHTYKVVNGDYVTYYDAQGRTVSGMATVAQATTGRSLSWNNQKNGQEVKDTLGNVIETGKPPVSINRKYIACRTTDTAWVFNHRGELLFSCRADDIRLFSNDCIAVKLYGLWALKDSTGKNLTEYKYCEFRESGYPNALESCNTLVSTRGKEIISSAGSSTMNWGNWFQVGWHGDILDRQYKVLVRKDTYEDEDFVGDRFIVLDREQNKKKRCLDAVTGKLSPFIAESYLGRDAYFGRVGGKAAIFKNGILKLPTFRQMEVLGDSSYFLLKNEDEEQLEPDDYRSSYFTVKVMSVQQVKTGTQNKQALLDRNMRIVLPMRYSSIQLINKAGYIMAADETGNYLFTPSGRKIRKLGPWPQVGQTGSIGLLQSPDSTVLVNDTGVLYLGPGIASLFFPVGSQYTPVGLPSVIAITGTNGNAAIYDCGMRLLVPEKYHIVAEKAPGILTLKLEDSIYFLNLAGKLLFGGRGFNGKNCMLLEGEVVLLQNETGKWGALDAAGRVIHPFIYNGLYGNNNQPILWNNTDTLRLDNTGTPMQQPSHAASLQARLAESRNWYTEVYATQQNLQPGLYIAPGKKLSDLGVRSKCYGFGVDDDYHFVFMITDTTGTQMAVIDTMGNQLIPFIPRPDVTVLSRYTVVALYNKGQSMLYRIKGNATERLNITLDAAHKDAIINRHKGNLGFTNSETVYCTAEGVGKAVILPHSRMPLLEPGIDSIKEVNGYLQVKKRTGWGLFNQGWLCPPVCDSIITEQSSGDKWLWKNGKTGVMVNRTQALIHPEYDHIFNPNTIEFNYFIAMKNGKYLLLDGKERLLAPAYDSIEVKDDPYRWSALRNLKAKRGGKKYLLSVNINGEIEEKETL